MRRMIAATLLGMGGLLLLGAIAQAAEPSVMRVLVVQPADLKAYVHELSVADSILKKAGVAGTVRAWQAQFAGEDAGTVVVQLEFANLSALAHYYEATRSNAELAAELGKIVTMRKVISDSLFQELTPK